jgi:hypothetical protein
MAIEIKWSEEKAKQIWSSEEELSLLLSGCRCVCVSIEVASGKHLVVLPIRVVFEHWTIELDEDISSKLAKVVDIIATVVTDS